MLFPVTELHNICDEIAEKVDVVDHSLALMAISLVPVVGDIFLQFKERAIKNHFDETQIVKERVHWLQEKNRVKMISLLGDVAQAVCLVAFVIFTSTSAWFLLLLIPMGVFMFIKVSAMGANVKQIEKKGFSNAAFAMKMS